MDAHSCFFAFLVIGISILNILKYYFYTSDILGHKHNNIMRPGLQKSADFCTEIKLCLSQKVDDLTP